MRVIFKDGAISEMSNVDSIIFNEPEVSVQTNGVASWIIHKMGMDSFMCNNCKLNAPKAYRFCPHCGFTMRNYNERIYEALSRHSARFDDRDNIGGTDDYRTEKDGSC